MNDYLIPVYQKQWKIVFQNLFFLPAIQRKIHILRSYFLLEDLSIYLEVIHLLQLIAEKEKLFENNTSNQNNNKNKKIFSQEAVSMMVRLTSIRLLPEYEIYHSIFGKPKKEEKETYPMEIIQTIQQLLTKENMDYDQMKRYLENKYIHLEKLE
jgi:hypothetical protein